MMTCRQAKNQIDDFVDGRLSADAAAHLNAHLAGCAACRREERAARVVVRALRSSPVPDQPDACERALQRFRAARAAGGAPSPQRVNWRPATLGFGLAGAALLVWFVQVLLPPLSPPGPAPASPAREAGALPSPGDLDRMTSLHDVHSPAVLDDDSALHRESLADANSRVDLKETDDAL